MCPRTADYWDCWWNITSRQPCLGSGLPNHSWSGSSASVEAPSWVAMFSVKVATAYGRHICRYPGIQQASLLHASVANCLPCQPWLSDGHPICPRNHRKGKKRRARRSLPVKQGCVLLHSLMCPTGAHRNTLICSLSPFLRIIFQT